MPQVRREFLRQPIGHHLEVASAFSLPGCLFIHFFSFSVVVDSHMRLTANLLVLRIAIVGSRPVHRNAMNYKHRFVIQSHKFASSPAPVRS